jgi:uncharacterized protein (DUF2267 family)
MSATGLAVFDTTLKESNHWLKIIMERLETDNREHAFSALRATLHALRDLIGVNNAVHLGAQLPMLLRGAFYENWHPAGTPTRERHLDDFLSHVKQLLPRGFPIAPVDAAQASLTALSECVDRGEMVKIANLLPSEIETLLPLRGFPVK